MNLRRFVTNVVANPPEECKIHRWGEDITEEVYIGNDIVFGIGRVCRDCGRHEWEEVGKA